MHGWGRMSSEKRKWKLVAQSCPTLCDLMDCIPPGSSVHGILQAGILGWVAIPFSREPSQPRDWTWVSYVSHIYHLCHLESSSKQPKCNQKLSQYWTSNERRMRKLIKIACGGIPWQFSGSDSMLPIQGAWVQTLVGELDPTCHNWEFTFFCNVLSCNATTKTQHSQITK